MKKATDNPSFGNFLKHCGKKHPQIKMPVYNISRQFSTFSFCRRMAPAFRKMLRNTSGMVYGNCAPETTVYCIPSLIITPLFFAISSARNRKRHLAAKLKKPRYRRSLKSCRYCKRNDRNTQCTWNQPEGTSCHLWNSSVFRCKN